MVYRGAHFYGCLWRSCQESRNGFPLIFQPSFLFPPFCREDQRSWACTTVPTLAWAVSVVSMLRPFNMRLKQCFTDALKVPAMWIDSYNFMIRSSSLLCKTWMWCFVLCRLLCVVLWHAAALDGTSNGSDSKKLRVEEAPPSRVLHIRKLPNEASETEVIALGLPFGKVTNILTLKGKNQVRLESGIFLLYA